MSENGDPTSIALSGRRVITKSQREAIADQFRTASVNARRATVLAFHQYGLSDDRMADLLHCNPEEIAIYRQQALKAVEEDLDSLPEAPLLMAQVVIEGYANLSKTVMAISSHAIEKLVDRIEHGSDDKDTHRSIQGYMRVMIEMRDSMTDRMERYGQLPLVPKNMLGQKNYRAPEEVVPFEDQLKIVAKKAGVSLDDVRDQIIKESVQ